MTVATPQVQTGDLFWGMAEASLAFFCQNLLDMELGDHHLRWSQLVNRHSQLDLLAARGHGKSGMFSYGYPLWKSTMVARNRGLLVSKTADQTAEFLTIIKEGKEYTDELGWVWRLPAAIDTKLARFVPKDFERRWTGEKLHFTNGSKVEGKTFGKRFRGRHVSWIVVDDPHGDEVMYSERQRDKDRRFLSATIEPMLLPHGSQIVVVGTPLHEDDIHGANAKNPEWHVEAFPAIVEAEDGTERALWPAFRSLEWLAKRKRSMGELPFNQEYRLRPISGESSLFPRALFYRHPETLATWLRLGARADEIEVRDWRYSMGVDIATSAEAGADFFVIIVLGVDSRGNRHIVDMRHLKGVPFSSQLNIIRDIAQPYHAAGRLTRINVEANAAQAAWGDELRKHTDLPIHKFVTTGQRKYHLTRGVVGLRLLLENGKLRFARGDARSTQLTDVIISELKSFGWLDGKLQGIGSHDDAVMALWLADRAVASSKRIDHHLLAEGHPSEMSAPMYDAETISPELAAMTAEELCLPSGKVAFIRAGHVPPGCSLPDDTAGRYIQAELIAGRSPCWTCPEDRGVCGGKERRPDLAVNQAIAGLQSAIEERVVDAFEEIPDPPPGVALRRWLEIVEACDGDLHLARMVPDDVEAQRAGWNAMWGGPPPPWVSAVESAGKGDLLFGVLERLVVAR